MSKPSAQRNHRTTLPQSALAGCQLPQRGSREWAVPFNVPLRNRKGAGDFHRPYETQRWVHSTIHRAAQKPGAGGRFSSPLRNSEDFTFYHSGEKMGVEFLGRVWYNSHGNRCRISSLVEWSLPKPQRRVRFPYPAPQKALASAGAFLIRKIRFFVEFSEFFGIIMEIPPPMEDMLWMR